MSIFASQTTSDPIPIPFDPPHTIVVRKMTGHEVDAAQAAHASGLASGRGWADKFARLLAKGLPDEQLRQVIADPLQGYDRHAVIRAGLLSWSYPALLTPVVREPAVAATGDTPARPAVMYDAIDDLEDRAVDFFARTILRKTKPELFLNEDEREDARKNAARPSTDPSGV